MGDITATPERAIELCIHDAESDPFVIGLAHGSTVKFMKRTVYLAGLISTDYPESLEWRDRVTPVLEDAGFEVRNPLDGKGNLKCVTSDGGITSSVTSNKSIILRDRRDVRESDIILAHLETFGSPRPLVGTIVEIGWAWDDQTPVVAVASADNYLMRKHPFVSECVTQYWNTVGGAVDFIIRYYGQKIAL